MKKFLLAFIGIAILVGAFLFMRQTAPAVNPDPNHTHADFAVWVNGTKLDFSDEEYMSAPPPSAASLIVPSAHAHGDEEEGPTLPGREFLHLHGDIGHVIHRHKPGLTLGDFFTSIGFIMTRTCFTLDQHQFEALGAAWVESSGKRELCNTEQFHWTFVVNSQERPMDPAYVMQDLDKILLSYGPGEQWRNEWKQMTDDACLYSKTCPWKGEPPAEGCVADPTVPCKE